MIVYTLDFFLSSTMFLNIWIRWGFFSSFVNPLISMLHNKINQQTVFNEEMATSKNQNAHGIIPCDCIVYNNFFPLYAE